jgi:hypothetical protein
MRQAKLQRLADYQALAMSADTTEEYLRWFTQENNLRAELEPLTTEEQFAIAKRTAAKITEYETA